MGNLAGAEAQPRVLTNIECLPQAESVPRSESATTRRYALGWTVLFIHPLPITGSFFYVWFESRTETPDMQPLLG